jgi:hypothetical protein
MYQLPSPTFSSMSIFSETAYVHYGRMFYEAILDSERAPEKKRTVG